MDEIIEIKIIFQGKDIAGNQGIYVWTEKMKVKPFKTFLTMKFWEEYEDLILSH